MSDHLVAAGGWLAAAAASCLAARCWLAVTAVRHAVARTTHEVRGPLTAVELGLRLALRGGGVPGERVRAVELELGRAALALGDLAAVSTGAVPGPRAPMFVPAGLEPLDLNRLVADSLEAWRGFALAHGVELVLEPVPPGVRVEGDRLRLAQALGNLIANAIEHGGGTVSLRARRGAEAARVEITDDGPGLPAPVSALAARHRGRPGIRGHGLAVVAEVAAAHGGRVAAAPSQRGARLVLELPLAGCRPGRPAST